MIMGLRVVALVLPESCFCKFTIVVKQIQEKKCSWFLLILHVTQAGKIFIQ